VAFCTFAAVTAAFCAARHGSRGSVPMTSAPAPARPACRQVASAPAMIDSTYSRPDACRASRREAPDDLASSGCGVLGSGSGSAALGALACAALLCSG